MNNINDSENCWLCNLALHHDDPKAYLSNQQLGKPVWSVKISQALTSNRNQAGELAWIQARQAGYRRGKDDKGFYYGFTINLPTSIKNKSNERRPINTFGK